MAEEMKNGYGKRPLWQWILLYVVIGGIVYGVIYYFVLAKNGNGYSNTTPSSMYTTPAAEQVSPTTDAFGGIFMVKTDSAKGNYLVGPTGMALYTTDKDTVGVSNCTGACLTIWPPYIARSAGPDLPTNITTIRRSDDTILYAWKGMAVYYYAKDVNPGDTLGDGVGGIWHLAKP